MSTARECTTTLSQSNLLIMRPRHELLAQMTTVGPGGRPSLRQVLWSVTIALHTEVIMPVTAAARRRTSRALSVRVGIIYCISPCVVPCGFTRLMPARELRLRR